MITAEKTVTTEKAFDHAHPLRVCFVCTGNTCRSPMAAAVLNHKTRIIEGSAACDINKLLSAKHIRATSAGLFGAGDPIARNAVAALEAAGIPSAPDNDYKNHVSRPINPEMMETADLVVGLTESHAMQLMGWFPSCASKITCMPHAIPDPVGGDEEDYAACLAAITEGIKELFLTEDNR